MASPFVHLHTHSEFSLLDGANQVDRLVERAKELEMGSLAITDHGVLYGAHTFYKAAKKAGIRPIIGMEGYVAPGSRFDREKVAGEKGYSHLVLLARDLVGYRNLVKLSSIGYTEGFYRKPRLDREVLARHSEGLIVTSACMAGEVAQHLLSDRYDAAREAAAWYAETFKDRYYLEVQAHDSPDQARLNRMIFSLGEDLGLPVVATNDAHFLHADDHAAHDMLLCIGLGKDYEDPNRMRYDRGLYFKAASEMLTHFPERPDVLERTLDIAEQVDLVFEKKYHVPSFPLPAGVETENELIERMTNEGLVELYGATWSDEVRERAAFELDVITKLGYSGYFLILADVIAWCRERDIPVGPGRGSAAGSLVAYALGITDLDPIRYDLLFERFLNPDRATMPDIDTDFAQEGRQDAIAYVRDKYGEDAVCQIITFGTLGAKGVLRDVGRTLGFSPTEMDRLTARIPNGMSIPEAMEQVEEVARLAGSTRPAERDLLRFATSLEGLSRHSSIHAAGVVIAPGPIEDYVPVATQKSASGERVKVTQYDMNAVEEQGLLKFDFLGVETLDQRDYTRRLVRERHGRLIVFDRREERRLRARYPEVSEVVHVDVEDPSIYALLRSGRTAGIFQLESALARDKLRSMRADRFEDIVATNALIRPGPLDTGMTDRFIRRKRGEEAVSYPHPLLEEVLEPTLGIIVYQEQVMRTAQRLAGYTLAEADILRKAVGKKDAELIAKEIKRFVQKAIELGVDRQVAEGLGADIEAFGRYGFNRSHSAAYSMLSVQSAYLKANYPAEFLAGVLSFKKANKIPTYLAEARDIGVAVLPPCVNSSAARFNVVDSPEGAAIRFGLGAIKHVGAAAATIIAERERGGPYTDFYDFVARMAPLGLQARPLEALIDAGACDVFGHRAQMLHAMAGALSLGNSEKRDRERGQTSLFGEEGGAEGIAPRPSLPDVPPMRAETALAKEKELLGFYVSAHPMDSHEGDAAAVRTRRLRSAGEDRPSGSATLVGIVTKAESLVAKKTNNPWGRITIEDMTGAQTIKAFGEVWERFGHKFKAGAVVAVRGSYQDEDLENKEPDFILDEADPLDVARHAWRQDVPRRSTSDAKRERRGRRSAADRTAVFDLAPEPSVPVETEPEAEIEAAPAPEGWQDAVEAEPEDVHLRLRLPRPIRSGDPLAERILRTLAAFPGSVPVEFSSPPSPERFREARSRVRLDDELLTELRSILGNEDVFLHPATAVRVLR